LKPPAAAQSSGKPQYISDDISVTLREKPSNDAAPLGALKSGARVTVLEVLGADSFARIRTADGREGWITARYISDQPQRKTNCCNCASSCRNRAAKSRICSAIWQAAQQQLTKAKPALDMAADNDKLRATNRRARARAGELEHRFDEEKAHRQTLIPVRRWPAVASSSAWCCHGWPAAVAGAAIRISPERNAVIARRRGRRGIVR